MHAQIAHSRSAIAAEGWPLLIGCVALIVIFARLGWTWAAAAVGLLAIALIFLFRDPLRVVPPLPAAVYSPVDGRIESVEAVEAPGSRARWWKLGIRVSRLGAYTVRAPIEGIVMQIEPDSTPTGSGRSLRLLSEEGDQVLLAFPRAGLLSKPRSFVRYGERLGQGHRFAYLRLAPTADVYLPASARLEVAAGERVRAGATVLAELVPGQPA